MSTGTFDTKRKSVPITQGWVLLNTQLDLISNSLQDNWRKKFLYPLHHDIWDWCICVKSYSHIGKETSEGAWNIFARWSLQRQNWRKHRGDCSKMNLLSDGAYDDVKNAKCDVFSCESWHFLDGVMVDEENSAGPSCSLMSDDPI